VRTYFGQGREGAFFRDFVRAPFMDGTLMFFIKIISFFKFNADYNLPSHAIQSVRKSI